MDLKVCMVASYFHPRGYGGNAVYELCRHLVKHGLEVHVITSSIKGEPDYQLLQGICVHRIPTYFLRLFSTEYPLSPTALNSVLKVVSNHADLIHAHFEIFQTTLASSMIKRITKKPMVLTMHGQGLTGYSSYGTAMLDFMWFINHNTVERFAARSADKIIALTKAVKAKALRLGAKPEKIFVIPNGVDTERFKPFNPSEEYYNELSITEKHKIVMFVGRLHPTHGIILLLHAIPQVIKVHPNSRFILVGDGPLKLYVLRFIKSRGLEKCVRALGYREDIPQLLNISHLVVYPALSVGMPLSVLEAMACGKPVICFNIRGNHDVIVNGKTGFFVQKINAEALASCITHALSDLDYLKETGQNARKYVAHNFTWESVTKRVIEVYRDLVFV